MILKTCELISILLAAMTGGMFWGPWLALSRSMHTFSADVFLAIAHRMIPNMASVMTLLMPITLLSMVPVLYLSYPTHPRTFQLTLGACVLFLIALLVTMMVEVPIVKRIALWSPSNLPDNWQQLRDRWGAFHIVRVLASIIGLMLLVIGALA